MVARAELLGGCVAVVWIEEDEAGLMTELGGALLLMPSRFDVCCCEKVVRGVAVAVAVVVAVGMAAAF